MGHEMDITERKLAEEALRESEERYKNVVDSSLSAIVLYRQEEIIFANKPFYNIFGYKPADLESLVVDDLLAPEKLLCQDEVATPSASYLDAINTCTSSEAPPATETPYSPEEAFEQAMHLNLTKTFSKNGPFDAFVYLWTPTRQECNQYSAEYIVVLSQKRK